MQSLNSKNHRALNVLLWGFGHMNKIIIRYLNEKNHKIVGVIGHHNIGENAFKIAGLLSSEYQVNITSAQNVQSLIIETQPDICILATKSLLSDIYLSLKILGENNVNVITLAEEPYYSWNTNPILTNELNDLFKLNNIVFTASGAQDMLWGVLPAVLVGSSHKITKIIGSVQFNVG
jgi:2,4-diaminopentanoate dehydrogenase